MARGKPIRATTSNGGYRMLNTDTDRIEQLARLERNRRAARKLVDAEGWKAPDPGRSLADSRKHPPAPVCHVVKELLPEGISMMSAQWKAGKTTLGIDLAACLAADCDFLEYFEVNDLGGNIGYWNLGGLCKTLLKEVKPDCGAE